MEQSLRLLWKTYIHLWENKVEGEEYSMSIQEIAVRQKKDIFSFDKIVLWGAGFQCKDTVEWIGKENIAALFDNNREKWGNKIQGLEVQSPKYEFSKYVDKDTAIIVSSNAYEYEIASELVEKYGVKPAQLFCNSNAVMEKYRFLPQKIKEHWMQIEKIAERFSDRESRQYYENYVKACLTRDPLYYTNNPRSIGVYEYDAEDVVIGVQAGDVIADCGAYIGDTAKLFLEKTNKKCEVYCFEPVYSNYKEMCEWVEKEKLNNVYPVNKGVGAQKCNTKVYSSVEDTAQGSTGYERYCGIQKVVSDIQVDSLDNMLGEKKLTYIKMDIEGAEMSALRGASNLIKREKPQMLISAYHKIEDLWEIPEYVLKLIPEYKLFLGHQPHAPYEPEFIFIV